MTANEFNRQFPVGTAVRYFPDPRSDGSMLTKTTGEAYTLSSGRVVIRLKGFPLVVSLSQIKPEPPQPDTAAFGGPFYI